MSEESLFGDVIHEYSRADALADGTLVDATTLAREAGIPFPTALTRSAWEAAVALTAVSRAAGQDEVGRLWDVLWLCAIHARNAKSDRFDFEVLVFTRGVLPESMSLRAVCGPGDDGAPVVTIMLPTET